MNYFKSFILGAYLWEDQIGGMGHAREEKDERWAREDGQRVGRWYVI